MLLNSYSILIFFSLLVIISYGFNLFSFRWKFPSVLFLLGLGLALRYVGMYFNFEIGNIQPYLELFGIIGLILIVFEAALDIKFSSASIPIIKKSFEVALLVLVLGVTAITVLFYYWFSTSWRAACLNAIPLAVISSAIVIPSIVHLAREKKEFLIYEATFSDIVGILIFNFMVQYTVVGSIAIAKFVGLFAITILVSILSSLVLLYMVAKIKDHVKIFLVLSAMILIYSFGKLAHLSSLLLIFMFGLFLSNHGYFFRNRLSFIKNGSVSKELSEFKLVVSESAFVIRTFFFVIFGFSIDLRILADLQVWVVGTLIVATLIALRFFYLKFLAKTSIFPELWIAPKGLVSILLFYGIPAHLIVSEVSKGILFFVICASSVLMAIALLFDHYKDIYKVVVK